MLCKMINVEERTATNGNLFYVCRFSFCTGNVNAEPFITLPNGMRIINPEVAALRQINLTKCLFPTEDANAKVYAETLHLFSLVCASESKEIEVQGKKIGLKNFNICLPLVYYSKPVPELTNGIEYVLYFDANNEEKKLYNFSVVGYSKIEIIKNEKGETDVRDLNEWDDKTNGNDLLTYMKNQFETNIANGTYTIPTVAPAQMSAPDVSNLNLTNLAGLTV